MIKEVGRKRKRILVDPYIALTVALKQHVLCLQCYDEIYEANEDGKYVVVEKRHKGHDKHVGIHFSLERRKRK
jgi:hypothetical protein